MAVFEAICFIDLLKHRKLANQAGTELNPFSSLLAKVIVFLQPSNCSNFSNHYILKMFYFTEGKKNAGHVTSTAIKSFC